MKQTAQKFLTKWVRNYLDKNWDNIYIYEDHIGCYGYNDLFNSYKKIDKSKFLNELKSDFSLVEWVIHDVMKPGVEKNPYQVFAKDTERDGEIPIFIYNFDGTYIKCYPNKTDKSYWESWNWEFTDENWMKEFDAKHLHETLLKDLQRLFDEYKFELPELCRTKFEFIFEKNGCNLIDNSKKIKDSDGDGISSEEFTSKY